MQHQRVERTNIVRGFHGEATVVVCECGWTSTIEYLHDDEAGMAAGWHDHLRDVAPERSVDDWGSGLAFPRGESTRAFMQRTDPVGYQQCRDAGRF